MTYRDDDLAATLHAEALREELVAEEATLAELMKDRAELRASLLVEERAARARRLRRLAAFVAVGLAIGIIGALRLGALDDLVVRVPSLRRLVDSRPSIEDGGAIQFDVADGRICQITFIASSFGRCHAPFACAGVELNDDDDVGFCADRRGIVEVREDAFHFVYSRHLGRGFAIVGGSALTLRARRKR